MLNWDEEVTTAVPMAQQPLADLAENLEPFSPPALLDKALAAPFFVAIAPTTHFHKTTTIVVDDGQ